MEKAVNTMVDKKMWAVNAGYRKEDMGRLFYYVIARNKTEAKKRFLSYMGWLDVYGVSQIMDEERIAEIRSHPERYICFGK